MDYIEKLKTLREDSDKGQDEIAKVLGCKQSAVSKYENGKLKYKVEDIIELCKFYGVSADYILGLPKNLKYPER